MKSFSKLIYLIIVSLFLSSCAKQNAGIVKQTYHDLTSHYNGYFNANENYNIQLRNLSKGLSENYDEVLPLYAHGNLEDISDKTGSLDASISKARLSIQTHQEKSESKNYLSNEDNSISNWSDDAFLLIGKSYYLQGELDSAISCFRYITANFDVAVDGRSKKKIKKQKNDKKAKAKAKKLKQKLIDKELAGKDVRPKNKIGLHESAKSEALVWLANSYISNKQYGEAESVLTYIRSDKTFLKNYDKDVELSNSFLYLSQESYSASIPYLESSIDQFKRQKNKARLQFILAQVLEKNGDYENAAVQYKKSMKSNSNFEMVFYAQLKTIQMNRGSNNGKKDVNKLIAKMLRDNKNKDYKDQLYYEKALIALENDEREDAKKYLEKSIEASTINPKQKGISFITLADMNYEEESYALAQAYYDSSLSLIDESFIDYNMVLNRSTVLTDLIANLSVIHMNDSLLELSNMSGKELESYLYKEAVDLVDAEIKNEEKNNLSNLVPSNNAVNKGDKNAWYFYSEASKNSGYKKFKQIWGDVALEDNWRRSDKSSELSDNDDEIDDNEDEYFARIDEKYQEMLAAVPSSDKEKKNLNTEIVNAFYNSAVIYKAGLDNLPKSIEMFETLNSRYPKNKYHAEALYQLYVLHQQMENNAAAKKVKNNLLANYPNDKYTSFIKDPRKLNELDKNKAAEEFYEQAYSAYVSEDFDAAILKCTEAKKVYPNSSLVPKFDLLKAMSLGGKKLYDPYVASLQYVVKTHAMTEEKERAEELLAYLNGKDPNVKKELKGSKEIIEKSKVDESTIDPTEEPASPDKGVKLKLGSKEINIGSKKGQDEVPLNKVE